MYGAPALLPAIILGTVDMGVRKTVKNHCFWEHIIQQAETLNERTNQINKYQHMEIWTSK